MAGLATIIVGLIAPYIQNLDILQGMPDTVQFILDGVHYVVLALITFGAAWVTDKGQGERLDRIVAAAIRYVEEQRGTGTFDPKALAIKIIKDELAASNLGWYGWVLKIPFVGKWILGSKIDKAASGVKNAAFAASGSIAIDEAKTKNNKPKK